MWKILVCLIVLVLVWDDARGDGNVILSGTIKVTGGEMCLQADGDSVAADNCVEVVVVDTAIAGQYLIQKLEGTRADNELTLANDPGNSFGTGGTALVFYSGSANLNTVEELTDADAAFIIRLASETAAPGDCLKVDGKYTTGGGCAVANDKWYFDTVTCKVTDCTTCNADVLVCDACPANEAVNDGGTECEACSTALHAQCTACMQDSGTPTCTTCAAGYMTDDTDGCQDCSTALHAQCTACNQDSGTPTCTTCGAGFITDATDGCTECGTGEISDNNACTSCDANEIVVSNACDACESDETPHSDRTQCVAMCTVDNCLYCDNAPGTCEQCDPKYGLADNACTACAENQIVSSNTCTDCADNQTPNSAGDGCVDACDDTNCQYCDSGSDSCNECNDGYTASNGACVEDQDTTTASTASDMISFVSVLILAVLTGRLMA